MSKEIKKIGVMTSGGDAPGMNAAIRAVVRACAYHNIECVGIYRGYDGVVEGDFKLMNARSVKGIINKGGTVLKSARSNAFRTKEGRKKAYDSLVKGGVDALVTMELLQERLFSMKNTTFLFLVFQAPLTMIFLEQPTP